MAEAELVLLRKLLATPEPPALGPARRGGTISETELTAALRPVLTQPGFPPQSGKLIRALLLLWHDHLDASHHISQGIENADGGFVHAIMHCREPDASNSKYWWRRVGAHPAFPELARRAGAWLSRQGAETLEANLLPDGNWDPHAFVDACDAALWLPDSDPQVKLLRDLQRIETEVLLEYLMSGPK